MNERGEREREREKERKRERERERERGERGENGLTGAHYAGILSVATVVNFDPRVGAVEERCLVS